MPKKGKVPIKPRIDGVDITTLDYDQLLSFVIAVGDELDVTRKETQDFRSDAYKLNKYLQLTVNQLEECGQEIRRLDSLLVDQDIDQEKLIHSAGQRVKKAQYDTGMAKKDMLEQYNNLMNSRREGLDDAEKEITTDIRVLANDMENMKLAFRGARFNLGKDKIRDKITAVERHFISDTSRIDAFEEILSERLESHKKDAEKNIKGIVRLKARFLKSVEQEHALERKRIRDVYDVVMCQNFNRIKHLKNDILSKMQQHAGISVQYKRLLDKNSHIRKTIHQSKTKTSIGFRATTTSHQLKARLKAKHDEIIRLQHNYHLKEIEKYHIKEEYEQLKGELDEQIEDLKKKCMSFQKRALQKELLAEEIKHRITQLITERKLHIDLIRATMKDDQSFPVYENSEIDDMIERLAETQKSTSKSLQLQLLSNFDAYRMLLCLYKRNLEINGFGAVYGIVSRGKNPVTM